MYVGMCFRCKGVSATTKYSRVRGQSKEGSEHIPELGANRIPRFKKTGIVLQVGGLDPPVWR
eukprot:7960223-Pyramimonas_sp.AAC.1